MPKNKCYVVEIPVQFEYVVTSDAVFKSCGAQLDVDQDTLLRWQNIIKTYNEVQTEIATAIRDNKARAIENAIASIESELNNPYESKPREKIQ